MFANNHILLEIAHDRQSDLRRSATAGTTPDQPLRRDAVLAVPGAVAPDRRLAAGREEASRPRAASARPRFSRVPGRLG